MSDPSEENFQKQQILNEINTNLINIKAGNTLNNTIGSICNYNQLSIRFLTTLVGLKFEGECSTFYGIDISGQFRYSNSSSITISIEYEKFNEENLLDLYNYDGLCNRVFKEIETNKRRRTENNDDNGDHTSRKQFAI